MVMSVFKTLSKGTINKLLNFVCADKWPYTWHCSCIIILPVI
jgi:hypothetical protein